MADIFNILLVSAAGTPSTFLHKELGRESSFTLSVANSPEEAFLLKQPKPDVIVGEAGNGEQTLNLHNSIQACEHLKDVHFVLILDKGDLRIKSLGIEHGLSKVFTLPMKDFELCRYILYFLSVRKKHRSGGILMLSSRHELRQSLKKVLEPLNVHLLFGESLADGEKILTHHNADLLIFDHSLPDGKGAKWWLHTKKSQRYPYLLSIGLAQNSEDICELMNSGADDFLILPWMPECALARVRNLLRVAQLNREVHSLAQQEQSSNYQKNRLLGVAAHDLRNPIGTMISFAEMLDEECEDEDQSRLCRLMIKSGEKALEIIKDTLHVSHIDSGLVELNIKEFDLNQLLLDTLSSFEALARKKELHLCYTPCTAPALVQADQNKMEQVLDNLLSNAIKYTPVAGGNIEIALEQKNECWFISIQDHGQGIAPEEMGKLFLPFSRTASRPTAGESTTGLGLYIVRRIVESHHGKVEASSVLKEGSCFSFSLPLLYVEKK